MQSIRVCVYLLSIMTIVMQAVHVFADDAVWFETTRVINNDATSDIVIQWQGARTNQEFDIYAAESPDASVDEAVVVATDVPESAGQWRSGEFDHKRPYFLVVDGDSNQLLAKTAVRLLPLSGGRNFRDIGGYRTADGRVTKWGKVFRSGTMNGITAQDYEFLNHMQIRVVCDFRSVAERRTEPTVWQAGEVDYFAWDDVADVSSLMASFLQDSELNAGQLMAAGYPDYLIEHGEKYHKVMTSLLANELPLAFNCSAGKDRTGVATALLLSVLGVPRETIVHDYALSDDYVDYMADFGSLIDEPDSPYAYLAQLPEESLRSLMASDPGYMEYALDEIDRRYGSMESFARSELGLTAQDIETLRNQLLEKY